MKVELCSHLIVLPGLRRIKNKIMNSKQVFFALVFLIFGFLITLNYQQTRDADDVMQLNDQEWEKDYYYRQQLIELEEKNSVLRSELYKLRQDIQEIEQESADEVDLLQDLVDTKANLQKLTGEIPIKGEGIIVTLRDSNFIPAEDHANQYIVHDRHIHQTVNELFSAGAKAISINGQRIYRNSYIFCVGPVIHVDGNAHPAPFIIEALGDQEILEASLNLKNGIIDLLVQDNIEVKLEKSDHIVMSAKEM